MASTGVDRISGVDPSVAEKAPVKAVSTTNITLSGEQTVGGISVAEGDRVGVTGQTDATENGIYVCSETAWARALDFNGNRDVVKGTSFRVANDDVANGTLYVVTADNPIVIGTTEITFDTIGALAGSDLDGTLVTVGSQVKTEEAFGFDSLEDFRASTYSGDEAIIRAANSGTTTGRMILKATGTTGGTPATTGNRFSALAAGEIINAGGYGYALSTDQVVTASMFGALADYATTKTDNLASFQAFLDFCPGKCVKVDPGSYYYSGELTCAGDDIDIDATGAKFYVDGASSSTGFVFGSSATDSEPNYFNFKW